MSGDWFQTITYGDLLDDSARRFPTRVALNFGERAWTFPELRDEVDRVARGLLRLGVQAGDVVGVWLVNRPEWYVTAFAIARIGAVLLPINTAFRAEDLRFVVRHSRCSTLVFATRSGPVSYLDIALGLWPDLADQKRDALALTDAPDLRNVVLLDPDDPPSGCRIWEEVLNEAATVGQATLDARARAVSPHDPVTVMYTSGTTGNPKGVVHSHHAIRNVVDQANRLNVRETDVILMYLPLFHAYAFYEGPLLSLATGARCVLLERFDAGETLRALERERATLCFGFTTHFQDLLDHPDFAATDRSSLRAGIMAVGPRSMEPIGYRVQREFGGRIVSGYGMTEIGVGATLGFLDEDEEHSAATSGYPLSGYEFRIVDPETGAECPRGEPGEVLIRSYQVTEGYLHDEVRTGATIDLDGWLHSGDVGVLLDDGYLKVLGRYKDLIRVGGENVDPAEVEAVYAAHPAVRGAVLVGVPNERLHEVGCICVMLAPGTRTDDLEDELLHLCDGRLAAFKRPRHLVLVEGFPMTASGKIQRHELRAAALKHLALADLDEPSP